MKRILCAWLGNTDIKAAEKDDPSELGPILSALKERVFDKIYILSNYPEERSTPYFDWLKRNTKTEVIERMVTLPDGDPTDYKAIYQNATKLVTEIIDEHKKERPQITYHISPGTSAMAATWIILSKSILPAELIQTTKERGLRTVDLPYEISAEYFPSADEKQTTLLYGLTAITAEFKDILHRSDAMKKVIFEAQLVAKFDKPVLIMGESGTGKELFATAIYNSSPRKDGPYKSINCGAISPELFESEFFGHQKGAFTGASADKVGIFEAADGGTLFLDEVGELSLLMQVKLLRAVQSGEFNRVGDVNTRKANVRIIAATNRDLIEDVSNGKFREDLFYRLAVGIIKIPPLRDRHGDITLLIDHFLKKEGLNLSGEARQTLINHSWPGNVRELENTISRLKIWESGKKITAEEVEKQILHIKKGGEDLYDAPLGNGYDIYASLDEFTRHMVTRANKESGGVKKKGAQLLGLKNYQTYANWLKKYGVG